MKIWELRRPIKENASMGAVGGGAIASTAIPLGGATQKKKKKRKLKNGAVVLRR